jgi:serine/threonine-protein kinase RsbW
VREEIEIKLPAEPDQLSLLRTMAGAIAMRADFDLDAIADLKIAVDEACSMLIVRAAKGSPMRCAFGIDEDVITVGAEVETTNGDSRIDEAAFGWHVLSTLTDTASWTAAGNNARPQLCLQLTVRRKVTGP